MAVTITWNGDTSNLPQNPFSEIYKIDDRVFTEEELRGAIVKVQLPDEVLEIPFDSLELVTFHEEGKPTYIRGLEFDSQTLVAVNEGFPETDTYGNVNGTYFYKNTDGIYTVSVTLPNANEEATPLATIEYNGQTIAQLNAGETATLSCEGKKMASDVVVKVNKVESNAEIDCIDTGITVVTTLPAENIDESTTYGISQKFNDFIIVMEDGTVMPWGEGGDYVATRPTENIKVSDPNTNNFAFYYVEDENEILLYCDVEGTGTYEWISYSALCELMGMSGFIFKGYVSDESQATEFGYYAIGYDGFRYYRYIGGVFEEVVSRPDALQQPLLSGVWELSLPYGKHKHGWYLSNNNPTSYLTTREFVNFTSDGDRYYGFTVHQSVGFGYLSSGADSVSMPDSYIVDFGAIPQTVTQEFYVWFTKYAKQKTAYPCIIDDYASRKLSEIPEGAVKCSINNDGDYMALYQYTNGAWAMCDKPTLFTLDGVYFACLEGMTWDDFVYSGCNADGAFSFIMNDVAFPRYNGVAIKDSNGYDVYASYKIKANHAYQTQRD